MNHYDDQDDAGDIRRYVRGFIAPLWILIALGIALALLALPQWSRE